MADTARILIKRYAGQRLYDPAAGRYVSGSELLSWKAADVAFCVRDARTGVDVTSATLAQATERRH